MEIGIAWQIMTVVAVYWVGFLGVLIPMTMVKKLILD